MKAVTTTVEEMHAVTAEWVSDLLDARVVQLHGELGAGKTTFVQGVAKALGVERRVKSPTYTLVNIHPVEHDVINKLVHVDLYRIAEVDVQELKQIGLDELIADPKALVMIEWPERLTDPINGLHLWLSVEGEQHTIETKTAH